jgi:hypothetical protein
MTLWSGEAKILASRLSARLDALVEATTQVRLCADARLALEKAAAVMAARLMPVEEALRVLEIDRGVLADAAALKKAYRAASMKSHPDRGGSTALMQRVNEAYEVLSQHHEPSRAGGKSKAEEEAEYAQAAARSLHTVQAALAKAFDPATFTQHFANATGKEFTADVKESVKDDYKKNPRMVVIEATWRSADGATVFSLRISVDLASAMRVRMLGGGEDSLAFTVTTRVEILHDSRKSKFQQRDWSFTSNSRVLMDPEDLFPAAKIKKMISGKEKARKFSARDMKLGMEKYLGAQIEQEWAQFPVGATVPSEPPRFPRAFHDRFVVKMWRTVLMRTPAWNLYNVEGPIVPKQGRQKFDVSSTSALESEALLDALVEMQKKAEGVTDGAKLAALAASAFKKAQQKDE